MSRLKRFAGALFTFGILVGVIALLVEAALWVAHKVVALPTALSVAIIAAIIAPISSILTLAVTKYYERRTATLQEIRTKKTAVYESLLDSWTQMLMGDRMGRSPKGSDGQLSHEFLQKLDLMSRGLIIWSNAEILRDWSRIRRRMANNGYEDNWAKMVADMEGLLRAIRADIGQSNTKLALGDIMGMFINDMPLPEITSGEEKAAESNLLEQQAGNEESEGDKEPGPKVLAPQIAKHDSEEEKVAASGK